jgi:hypothetical protein
MRRNGRFARLKFTGVLAGLTVLCGLALPAVPAAAVPTMWHVTPSPNGRGGNQLNAISCHGPRFCAAVGEHLYRGTLAEIWDGRHWSLTPSVSPGHEPNEGKLTAVSCPTSTFCAAVGYDFRWPKDKTLIEIWNGHRWSVTPSPTLGNYTHLQGVSCTSSTDCEAVGFYLDNCTPHAGGSAGLVERWNGHVWSIVRSPRNSCHIPELDAVSCRSASHCTAVGEFQHGAETWTLVESWDGTRWSVVPSPNAVPTNNNFLDGVSCSSANRCMAVGAYQRVYAGPALLLAESWNGTKWSIVATPKAHPKYSSLFDGVSCTSPANCVAAGFWANDSGSSDTLVATWDGSTWSLANSPNPRPSQALYGVACTGASSCEAVGFAGKSADTPSNTLVETGS